MAGEDKPEGERALDVAAPGLELSAISVDGLIDELHNLGEAGFRAKHPKAFLVLVHAPPAENDWLDLETSESSIPRYPPAGKVRTGLWALPLVKTRKNAFASKVTLGRARNNDLVVRSAKVSKLHCTFYPTDPEGFELADMGSLNGTVVNGTPLEPKQRRSLKSGDFISIWRYVFEYVDQDGLLAKLR